MVFLYLSSLGHLTLMSRSLPLASMTSQGLGFLSLCLVFFHSLFCRLISYWFPLNVGAQQHVALRPPSLHSWALPHGFSASPWPTDLVGRPLSLVAPCCRFSSIPGLYPPEAGGTPSSDCKTLEVSRHRQVSSGSKVTPG